MVKLKSPLLVLLLLVFTAGTALAAHKDYSKRGGEYLILKDTRLAASKVDFVEKRSVVIEGREYQASVFRVRCRVTIQTQESYISSGSVWEDLVTEYELVVGNDTENLIHNKLISDIYEFLSTNIDKPFYPNFDATLSYRNGSYVIYDRLHIPRVVWFDGRFLQLKFLHFAEKKKSGFGAEPGFWEDKVRFMANGEKIPRTAMVNGLQHDFLRMYKQGNFRRD